MSDNAKVSCDSLPVEIVTQILLRLPIKSIIISTSVCKTWKSIIQNPTFISTHLHHSINNNNNHNLLLFRLCEDEADITEIYALHNDDDNDFTEHTRKFLKLPYPNVTFTHGEFDASIGFGFDPKTNDYKVVRVLCLEIDPNILKDRPAVEVFTLSSGEWRMVTAALPPICVVNRFETQVFVNGAIHWLAFKRSGGGIKLDHFVLVFNLGDEVFHEILLPKLPSPGESSSARYMGDERVRCWRPRGPIVLTVQGPGEVIPRAIGFRRNGKVVLKMDERKLSSQDIETQEKKDLRITSYVYTFVDSYVESLVLLDKAANGAVTY
uniref:F-box domain-containing protein n=1 Tax=Fagus sylvatica TaxID=28930 RepID=A0A2N9IPB9_FAGSY